MIKMSSVTKVYQTGDVCQCVLDGVDLEIRKGEAILDRLLAEDACVSLRQLAVNGNDLLDLGFRGPDVGRVLKELLNKVVDGELPNERESLLRFVIKS